MEITLGKKKEIEGSNLCFFSLYILQLTLNLNETHPVGSLLSLCSSIHSIHIYQLLEQSSLLPSSFFRCRRSLEVPDLLEQIVLLITELLIL